MLYGQVLDTATQRCWLANVYKAANTWERARGLLGRQKLDSTQGFWIEPCPSVHTIGMRYALDIIFMDKDGRVKKIVSNLKPLRFASCYGACVTLELLAGQAQTLGIEVGMQLIWEEKN